VATATADELTPYCAPDVGLGPLVTERVHYDSADGTRVSMFLVHPADAPRDGRQPVRLCAYGGFNIPLEPRYTPVNTAWLHHGGTLAVAHIRGGGEYGREWHEAATTSAAVHARRQRTIRRELLTGLV
jgi:prolyl oligopeptidase